MQPGGPHGGALARAPVSGPAKHHLDLKLERIPGPAGPACSQPEIAKILLSPPQPMGWPKPDLNRPCWPKIGRGGPGHMGVSPAGSPPNSQRSGPPQRHLGAERRPLWNCRQRQPPSCPGPRGISATGLVEQRFALTAPRPGPTGQA